jgi:hypothetical protein
VKCQPRFTIRSMTKKEFDKYLARDKGCWHCGSNGDDLIPHHRLNRGMGSKNSKANQPSNIVVLCAEANGLLESNAKFAELGRKLGWKLRSHETPTEVPIFGHGGWWLLNDDFTKDLLEMEPEYF